MSGGLMQLVAYGAQDIYLTGNPQITFFKVVYRRHTNFAMEAIEQTFMGTADFGKKVTCLISRNGDLIYRVYLNAELPATQVGISGMWTNDIGNHLIDNVNVEIGGQQIDKHYGDWLQIWAALTVDASHRNGFNDMIGETLTLCTNNSAVKPATTLFIPLQFWFCRNAGLALPLIALQYHEVKINVTFRSFSSLWINTNTQSQETLSLVSSALWVDYIYLDTDERRRFAQVSHEYLIDQLQFTGAETITSTINKIRLNFNHPVKELIWVVQKESHITVPSSSNNFAGNQWSNYQLAVFDVDTPFTPYDAPLYGGTGGNFSTTGGITDVWNGNPTVVAKLQLNGQDRFAQRSGRYFNLVQVWQHHTNAPMSHGICVYSFGLKPEEHQPSGTCNFSRIDNATMQLTVDSDTFVDQNGTTTNAQVRFYATNYNVLRIMSGMGGLAYSN